MTKGHWIAAVSAITLSHVAAMAQTGGHAGPESPSPVSRAKKPSPYAITVIGQPIEDAPAKLDFIPPEVDGTKITVTKKGSTTKLALQPTVIGNNQQQLFARSPGMLITEQQTPGQFNFNYRGLGNPQESEFILALQDGLPISTDWIGFPTLYYTPLPQGISEIQLIRGGSSLLYGPNPAPAINFVSKRPRAGEPISGYSENTGGSHGLFSNYNTIEGSAGKLEFRAAYGHVHNGGRRHNDASDLDQADFYVGYRPNDRIFWYVDSHYYNVSANSPGRIGYGQFLSDPDYSSTPFNHDWVRRTSVTLGNETTLGGGWKLETKAWAAWQTLHNRTAANQLPGAPAPATTTITDELFRNQGADIRAVKRWGHGNALTFGGVVYHDNAPYRQFINTDLTVSRDVNAGTPRLDQKRNSYYQAVFAENVFRLPHRWHVVPSFRLEHEVIDIAETVRPPNLTRPLINTHVSRTLPLFGLGAGFDFGKQNETYFSVTQGYRPLRFFDVASPFSNVGPGHAADPQKSLSWEAGVHGTPVTGLFYDFSLFWIDFRNRIETITLSNTDVQNQNSGDTRHRGLEGELSYDFLAHRSGDLHLVTFGNLALLDAEFIKSRIVNQVGKTPAYAPGMIAKYGISFRRDKKFSFSVTGVTVTSQYWLDSNAAFGSGATFIPAKIPGYTVVDISGDYYLTKALRMLGGISNIGNRRYYNRVFQNGIEPALDRRFYGGLAIGF
jgi:Fe(3+) dicitrate transport protein